MMITEGNEKRKVIKLDRPYSKRPYSNQTPQIDIEFAKLVCWGHKNLTQREKDLIYIFENFQKAYLSMKEIKNGKMPTKFYKDQMLKVIECLKRQNIPFEI